jgi:hypothetical protein
MVKLDPSLPPAPFSFLFPIKVGKKKLLKIPSFMTIYQAMKKGLVEIGIAGITDPMADSYDY